MNDFEEYGEAREDKLVTGTRGMLEKAIKVHERKNRHARPEPLDEDTIEAALELFDYNPELFFIDFPAREFIEHCHSVEFDRLTENQRRQIFKPILKKLFTLFKTRPQLFRQHQMYLYALFPVTEIAAHHPDVLALVPHQESTRSTFILKAQHKDWFLCDATEIRAVLAIQAGLWTLVYDDSQLNDAIDPLFFVKKYGHMTALCLQDFHSGDGKFFKRGHWYSPSSEQVRTQLSAAMTSEDRAVSLSVLHGEWTYMRDSDTNELILSDIEKHHALNTPKLEELNKLDKRAVRELAEMSQFPRRSTLLRRVRMANEGDAAEKPVLRLIENLIKEQIVTERPADPHSLSQPEHNMSIERSSSPAL